MAITTTFNSLSGVIPFELTYAFKSSEELEKESIRFSNGFVYNTYSLFANLQDVVLSKNNALFLTDRLSLSASLKEKTNKLDLASMPALTYLKVADKYVSVEGKDVYGRSSSKTPLFFSLIEDNKIEILVNKTSRLEVAETYPYTVYVSPKATTTEQIKRQQFDIDVADGKLTIKTITQEGPRYLAFDCSSTLRATGVVLNEVSTNNYIFTADPLSRTELTKGSVFSMDYVRYFNEFNSSGNKKNIYVKETETANTHWLVSTTLQQLINNTNNVSVNMMPLKTNFTPTGVFLTNPNE